MFHTLLASATASLVLCVCHGSNAVIVTTSVAGITTSLVLSSLPDVFQSVCAQVCHPNVVITMHDAVTEMYRCDVGIKMKDLFEMDFVPVRMPEIHSRKRP